jgi:hypothetical protein
MALSKYGTNYGPQSGFPNEYLTNLIETASLIDHLRICWTALWVGPSEPPPIPRVQMFVGQVLYEDF